MANIHLIGNAHLDPVWQWRWQDGCNEVMQTFRSALDRMKEYEDFVFTCSSAAYYAWVEELDPDMFAEIVQRVREGRWVPVNGWWVQPDCNMPSGESFARQALYSQRYYMEKFGFICRTGYNVDSFGHNGNLPQLLQSAGMRGYVMMRPQMHENGEIPQDVFVWEGVDGTKIPVFRIPRAYCGSGKEWLDGELQYAEEKAEKNGYGMMLFYGVGNHGGGPTRFDIEYLRAKMGESHFAPLHFSSPDAFFEELAERTEELPLWHDDLQHHASGCYSVVSRVKMLNRQAENRLQFAENWNTVAAQVLGTAPATEKFAEAWKKLCFNQFHDVLCGCCIPEALADTEASIGRAIDIAADCETNALIRLARSIDTWVEGVSDPVCSEVRHLSGSGFPVPVVVFNPHSFAVTSPMRALRHTAKSVKDSDGNPVLHQVVQASRWDSGSWEDTLFLATVPPMGYAVYWLDMQEQAVPLATDLACDADGFAMENSQLKVRFDPTDGTMCSLVQKSSGKELLAGKGALPVVIDDMENDTWAHNRFFFHDQKGTMTLCSMEYIEKGPLRAVLRIKHCFGTSQLIQDFILSAGAPMVRVKCKVVWQEPRTLLKLAFPAAGGNPVSSYEIPYGFIQRPANGEEEPALRWADVTTTAGGISIINNGKYSYDCVGNTLRLTCLRNARMADHYWCKPDDKFIQFTDEGMQQFEYAVYPHDGAAADSRVVQLAAEFNCRPFLLHESYHKGALPQKNSFLQVNVPNVQVTAYKLAEDGSGDTILRCYETAGKDTTAVVTLAALGVSHKFQIGARKVCTFRIAADGTAAAVDFVELPVE